MRAAVALGSGGARGYAHIGVLQELQARGIEIVSIAGSSMGALVGGLHAAGQLDAYTEWVSGLSQLDLLRLLDVSLTAPGAIRAEKIFARVHELLDGVQIEDLPVPFTAVATDLLARKAVWFQHGPVETAIRASIAMPGVFTPLVLNGRVLVDGGMIDPVPVAPTASARADMTIAVDLGGERAGGTLENNASPAHESAEPRPIEEWGDRFRRRASSLFDREFVRSLMSHFGGESDPAGDAPEAFPSGLGRFDVMNQSLEVLESVLTRYRLAGNPPDVLVTVAKDSCRTLDFHRAREMIALGRQLTSDALDDADTP
jgi:NTE family protein